MVSVGSSGSGCRQSWEAEKSEVAQNQQETDQLSQDLLSVSDSEEQRSRQLFWANLLLQDTQAAGIEVPIRQPDDPVQLLSCCTGAFGEAVVFKERV